MILKKIKIKNIRSYKDAEIDFPEGSILLTGDIGSGKTSVLLAIEFALFGLQPGQKANSILRSNENEAFVELELEVDERQVIISRGLKKSGKSISQTDTSIKVGYDVYEGSVTETKNKILSLLSYPPEFAKKTNDLYKYTVYTPQEEMKQIILESNDTRLNTLRHIFGIDKYKRIEENIDILTTRLKQEIKLMEFQLGNIDQKRNQVIEKQQLLEQEKIKLLEIEKNINDIQKIKIEKQQELELVTTKINEKIKIENDKDKSELILNNKKDLISGYEREIITLNDQVKIRDKLSFKQEDIDLLKSRIKTQEQFLRELNDQYLTIATTVRSGDSTIQELQRLKDKILSLDKCPTCLQLVNDDHKHNIISKADSELSEKKEQYEKSRKEREIIMQKLEQTKNAIENMKTSLSTLEITKIKLESIDEKIKRMADLEKLKINMHSDLEMLKKHITNLDEIIKGFDVYTEVYNKKNQELKEILIKENSSLIKRAESNSNIRFLETQISELNQEVIKIQEVANKITNLKELEQWLNSNFIELILNTERNVMIKLREQFSELFSKWFSTLVTDAITVRLDESFTPIIQQQDYELDYNFLSGGERTAIALAYRLALNQVINSLLSKIKTKDIVILDEPTDGFSESQLDKIRDVLGELKVKQLILVSHEPKIEGFVDNIIRFKKSEGITTVEKTSA